MKAKPKSRSPEDELTRTREEAWTGDAVLSLYARMWILRETGGMDGGMLTRMSSNQFLACLGNPTEVEAVIGRIYATEGLEAAFEYIERELVPLFVRQEKNRVRQERGRGRK